MAREPKLYTKLAGRGLKRQAFGLSATRSRLWLAADHLLAVDFTVASEEYRRFYFRDIEAIVVRRTAQRQIVNWILLVLAALTAGPFVFVWRSEGEGGWLVAAISAAVFWAILILVNSVRGARCQTHVRTAVQLELLPSLGRLPVARKFLARIRPLIETAQGTATPAEIDAAPWQSPEIALAGSFAADGPASFRAAEMRKPWLHAAAFLLLLANAAIPLLALAISRTPLSAGSVLAVFLGFIVCLVAAIRPREKGVPRGLRRTTFAALAIYVLQFVAGFVFAMIYTIRLEGAKLVTGLEIAGEPGFNETLAASAAASGLVATLGLILTVRHFLKIRGEAARAENP